jgi:hypothetical protein
MNHVDFLARRLVSIGTALCVLWGGMSGATAMTEEQARSIIAPWYRLFNLPVQGDMRKLQEEVLTSDYQSCAGYLPNECWGRGASIKIVGGSGIASFSRGWRSTIRIRSPRNSPC